MLAFPLGPGELAMPTRMPHPGTDVDVRVELGRARLRPKEHGREKGRSCYAPVAWGGTGGGMVVS